MRRLGFLICILALMTASSALGNPQTWVEQSSFWKLTFLADTTASLEGAIVHVEPPQSFALDA